IRAAAPAMDAFLLERAPDLAIVIELAVEHDHVAAVGRRHGLMPGRGQVDDRQAPEAGRAASRAVAKLCPVVGAAERERSGHRLDRAHESRVRAGLPRRDETGYAAHRPYRVRPRAGALKIDLRKVL